MATLADIRQKVRRVTGRFDVNQMTDAEIDSYINTFYLNDLPEYLKLFNLKGVYSFVTLPNVDTYDLPQEYLTVENPIFVAGYQIEFQIDPQIFYGEWPKISTSQQIATGNGGVGPYTGQISSVPILPGNSVIFSDSEHLTDDSNGNLFGSDGGSGTINYITGDITATFANPIPLGQAINAQYTQYQASRPYSLLYFNNKLTLRPVPDKCYKVDVTVFRQPSKALSIANDTPELNSWWELIAYGASLKIFADSGELEELSKYNFLFDEQMTLAQRRTLVQLSTQRTATRYSDANVFF